MRRIGVAGVFFSPFRRETDRARVIGDGGDFNRWNGLEAGSSRLFPFPPRNGLVLFSLVFFGRLLFKTEHFVLPKQGFQPTLHYPCQLLLSPMLIMTSP